MLTLEGAEEGELVLSLTFFTLSMPMQILYSAAVSECCDVKDISNYFPFHKGHATYTFLNLGGDGCRQ